MLVLSRFRDESIIIGDDIQITVIDIRADTVRLGIEAPKELSVHREEVYVAIQKGKLAAHAATDVRGLAGADAEQKHYIGQSLRDEMFEDLTEEDDQPLQDKMNDELERR